RVGLLKGFENDTLLVERDADTGVGNFKGDDGGGAAKNGMSFAPTLDCRRNGEADATLFGELESVGEQIFEDLLKALRVGDQAAAEARIDLHFKSEVLALGFVAEGAGYHVEEAGKENLFGFDGDGAGFDFG